MYQIQSEMSTFVLYKSTWSNLEVCKIAKKKKKKQKLERVTFSWPITTDAEKSNQPMLHRIKYFLRALSDGKLGEYIS